MNPWTGNLTFLICLIASIAIRIPHDKRSQETKVVKDRKGAVEKTLLGLVMAGLVVFPLLSFTPVLSFARYPMHPVAFALGLFTMLLSLWIFHRSHEDLGRNWSATLEIRESHALITNGIYQKIRHPMYTSIFLMAIGQALLLPNWLAGPATLFAFTLMFVSRLHTEEQMMLDQFGAEYEAYRQRTKRIIPGIW